jgi:predicted GNAT superfamily acetyltransferase
MTHSMTHSIRDCTSFDDFQACIRMQREVWQFSDLDITPLRSFVIALNSGGFTLGAFDPEGHLLGFCHALAAFDASRQPYYYSQMTAVTHEAQNAGIGLELKLAQLERARERGVPLIVWTFDPLQSRNAYFNLVKLGAVVRSYRINYYGNTSTSVLHRGLDTDRVFAEWWVDSEHTAQVIAGRLPVDRPQAVVEIPAEINEVKAHDPAEAQRWQSRVREEFRQHLADGLYCAGFTREPKGLTSKYLFFTDHEDRKN